MKTYICEARELAKLVASTFDPIYLNSKRIVVVPEIDETLILEGWDDEKSAWRLTSVKSNTYIYSKEIADYVMLLRVKNYLAYNRLTVFSDVGEVKPMFTDLVIKIADEWRFQMMGDSQ